MGPSDFDESDLRRYRCEGDDLWQHHPVHGERKVCTFDGDGRIVEIDGDLLVLDMVHCMGDKEGRLTVYDSDTLAVREQIGLDSDAGLGFHGTRFLVSRQRGGENVCEGWSLPDWSELGTVEPMDKVIPLRTLLTPAGDLESCDGRVTRSLSGREEVYPWAPPITDAEREALLRPGLIEAERAALGAERARKVLQVLDEGWPNAEVTHVEVEVVGMLWVHIWTRRPGLLIGNAGAEIRRLKAALIGRFEVEDLLIGIVEERAPADVEDGSPSGVVES
jgi:hypothetical protein